MIGEMGEINQSEITSGRSRNVSRKDFIRTMTVLGLGTALARCRGGSSNQESSTRHLPEMENVTEDEKLARLRLAGLGDFIDFFQIQEKIGGIYGQKAVLFGPVFSELHSVAHGEKRESEVLSEGFRKSKKPDLVQQSNKKISDLEITGTDEDGVSRVKLLLGRLAKVFPVLILMSPPGVVIDGNTGGGYNTSRLYQGREDIQSGAEMEFYNTVIHELGHAIDSGMDMQRLLLLKKYVSREQLVNYLTAYSEAVYQTVDHWGRLPVAEANKLKLGLMLDIDTSDQVKRKGVRQKIDYLKEALTWNESDYEQELGEALIDRGYKEDWREKVGESERLRVEYNLVAHKAVNYLITKKAGAFGEWVTSGDQQIRKLAAKVVNEVTHFMVGPIYRSGGKIYDKGWEQEMNTMINMASMLEEARLRMVSGDGQVPTIDSFMSCLYPTDELKDDEQVVDGSRAVYGNEVPDLVQVKEWPEDLLFEKSGAIQVSRWIADRTEESVSEFRVYRLPDPPAKLMPDQEAYLVAIKRHWIKGESPVVATPLFLAKGKRWKFGGTVSGGQDDSIENEVGISFGSEGKIRTTTAEGEDRREWFYMPNYEEEFLDVPIDEKRMATFIVRRGKDFGFVKVPSIRLQRDQISEYQPAWSDLEIKDKKLIRYFGNFGGWQVVETGNVKYTEVVIDPVSPFRDYTVMEYRRETGGLGDNIDLAYHDSVLDKDVLIRVNAKMPVGIEEILQKQKDRVQVVLSRVENPNGPECRVAFILSLGPNRNRLVRATVEGDIGEVKEWEGEPLEKDGEG